MIKDAALLEEFERNLKRKEKADYLQNQRILEGMLEEAIHLKIFPLKDPLDGIEVDIRVARVINSV
jgi:hypothetical protein